MTDCSVIGCARPYYGAGWCELHYDRVRRRGTPDGAPCAEPGCDLLARPVYCTRHTRFSTRTVTGPLATPCEEFIGSRDLHGYGFFRCRRAHILTWERIHGPVPDGLEVCHHCDNPPCCNPAHLFLGTHKQNMDDRDAKGRNPRGMRIGNSKLTDADVAEIRDRYGPGITQRELADEFGVHQTTVMQVVRRLTWTHLP